MDISTVIVFFPSREGSKLSHKPIPNCRPSAVNGLATQQKERTKLETQNNPNFGKFPWQETYSEGDQDMVVPKNEGPKVLLIYIYMHICIYICANPWYKSSKSHSTP